MLKEAGEGRIPVWVDGLPIPEVQWFFQDAPIPWATDPISVLPVVTRELEGLYWLTASNALGQATSAPIAVVVSNVDVERVPALAWPGDATKGLTIEFADCLGSGARWHSLIDYPPSDVDQHFIEFDTQAAARFYRLSAPGSTPAFAAAGVMTGWRHREAAGTTLKIQYVDEAGGGLNWQELTTLTLPESPYLFIDEDSLGSPMRIYRTTPIR